MKIMVFRSISILLGVAFFLVAGCHSVVTDPRDPRFIVAENGHWQITRAELDQTVDSFFSEHLSSRSHAGPEAVAAVESGILDKMVLQHLILARAATMPSQDTCQEEESSFYSLKGRFPNEAEFEKQLKIMGPTEEEVKKRIHEQILMRKVIEAEALQDVVPTEQELHDFYLGHPQLFAIPAKVRVSRILVLTDSKADAAQKAKERQTIEQARARVLKGEDFAVVARQVSQDLYSASRGGDIGFFKMGENEGPFDDMAFRTKVGEVSPVFETLVGYWILKVTGIQPAGQTPFAEAKPSVLSQLTQQKKKAAAARYFEKLKSEGSVVYHIPHAAPTTVSVPDSDAVKGVSSARLK